MLLCRKGFEIFKCEGCEVSVISKSRNLFLKCTCRWGRTYVLENQDVFRVALRNRNREGSLRYVKMMKKMQYVMLINSTPSGL